MNSNIDEKRAPRLRMLLASLSSQTSRRGHRRFQDFDAGDTLRPRDLSAAVCELGDPEVAASLRADQFVVLTKLAWVEAAKGDVTAQSSLDLLRALLEARWQALGAEVIKEAIEYEIYDRKLFEALPILGGAPEVLDAVAEASDGDLYGMESRLNFEAFLPQRNQLRRVLPALQGPNGQRLRTRIISGMVETRGWSPWVKLFAILWHFPELGSANAPSRQESDDANGPEDETQIRARRLWSALYADTETRHLAGLVQDLAGPLAESPPDFRDVYIGRLRTAVSDDPPRRQAAIEALLWQGTNRSRGMAAFAATHLARAEDLPFLEELLASPDRRVQYAAGAVLGALQGPGSDPDPGLFAGPSAPFGTPPVGTVQSSNEERPRTWLGNRVFERMLEATVAAAERQIACDYATHHGSGEERLGERFFTMLGERLQYLENALHRTAEALGDVPPAGVKVRYRPVDKVEEGKPGIKAMGAEDDADKFAADFCLVVTAYLNGAQLTRRAVLVQAKRLYPNDNKDASKGWAYSFRLAPEQARNLIEQTASSFFMFLGPVELQLGAGVIPARLVEDLALNQLSSARAISNESVRHASETFAEWFTYQLVGLRTGDPFQTLVDKAERGPGSEPYPLMRCGTVEIDVRLGEPSKEG